MVSTLTEKDTYRQRRAPASTTVRGGELDADRYEGHCVRSGDLWSGVGVGVLESVTGGMRFGNLLNEVSGHCP